MAGGGEPVAGEGRLTKRTAVVGAGLAGLACARVLRRSGCYVEVFEADRIVGGRLATTRMGLASFDHGAQYVTARSTQFQNYLKELNDTGYAARWTPRSVTGEIGGGQILPWYVGTPGMASMVRPLAESVRIRAGRRVHTIERVDKGWFLWFDDETSVGPFAAVAITVPAPEATMLLGRLDDLAEPLTRVRMSPCWSLMVRLEQQAFPEQDVYSDMSEVIRWIARNSTKPGRGTIGESIVVHASQGWSREMEDVEPEVVADALWGEVCQTLGLKPVRPAQMVAHLWKHGIADQHLGESYVFSTEHRVGVAGDWCLGRLAEHAFESGASLGRAIIAALN